MVRLGKLAGLCGLLTPVVAFTAIGASIALSPWFSWARNALSDLGALSSPVWPVFNTGLVVAGLLASFFSYGLLRRAKGSLGKVGSAILLIGSISLALIGLLPEDTGLPHLTAAMAFFLLSPAGLVVIGVSELPGPGGRWASSGLLASALGGASLLTWAIWALLSPPLGLAVPEVVAAVLISAALAALDLEMARAPEG